MDAPDAAEACRLYLITPPRLNLEAFAEELEAALSGGDVACLQLRLKDVNDDAVRQATERLMPICHAHDVAFLINDRPDLAAELRADGVHVGQEDASYREARKLVGEDAIVGVTCHDSKHLAITAAEQGADYVAFGAFFPTDTKKPKSRATVEILEWWAELMEVPAVAIGGITVENCGPLVTAGADFLAVVGGVWNLKDGPKSAVSAFNQAIAAAVASRQAN